MSGYVNGTSAKKEGKYNYRDYLSWPDEERWEIISGIAYNMSPAPSIKHQRISRFIMRKIDSFLDDKPCEVLAAPVDVILEEDSVVQPDIIVVCDKSKLGKNNCNGAPDLVIEILSNSTAYRDLTEKRLLYERSGVIEYWIINPDLGEVMKFIRSRNTFEKPVSINREETLKSLVLDGFELSLEKLFDAVEAEDRDY